LFVEIIEEEEGSILRIGESGKGGGAPLMDAE
jgi:hypothetical protein